MSIVTIVLVHGALLTSSSWAPVKNYLENRQVNVVTINVPGRGDDHVAAKDASLQLAADKLCKVINKQTGPVIVAGHSQAGAVITQALDQCGSHINGLVYIAAVVPHNGEKAFDLLNSEDGSNFDKVATLNAQAGEYVINSNGPIKEMFMDDATPKQARKAIRGMVSEPVRLGSDTLQYNKAAFNSVPKFYIKTTQDKIISPATQDKYIARDQFQKIYTMNTSHSPFVSQPRKLGQNLASIADFVAHSWQQE